MADQTLDDGLEATPEAEEAPPGLGGRRKLVVLGAGLLLLLGIAAGLYFTGFANRFLGRSQVAEAPPPKPASWASAATKPCTRNASSESPTIAPSLSA